MSDEERVALGESLVSTILEQLGLQWQCEFDTEIWLDVIDEDEPPKPDLRVVK